MSTTLSILLAVLLVSSISLIGVVLLSLNDSFLRKTLMLFVSFAVGALFANVFLHLLPEMAEGQGDLHQGFALVLAGILLSFVVEKFIHWHHCHNLECEDVHPVGTLMLIGDGVHNITDGILIATTFLISTEVGIATTIAIILHEIPQEIGDFAVLIHSGWSKSKALLANFLSAITAFIGAIAVLILSAHIENVETILLPITAGNFLYIAGSDLIPELHKETKLSRAILQLLSILAGIGLIYSTTLLNGHEQHTDEPVTLETHDHP